MSSAEGYVLPKPGVPKTLGILNIIFGVILVLYGLCSVGGTVLGPVVMKFSGEMVKKAQAKVADQRKADLKKFDDLSAAAKTDEDKKAIADQKSTFEANNPPDPEVDFEAITSLTSNPTIMGYTIAQAGTGVLMNIALLVAGIGLIRLSSWGRKMALWLAGIQIVRLAILTAVSIIVVQPVAMEATQKMIAEVEAQEKAKGPAPAGPAGPAGPMNPGANLELAKMMAAFGSVGAVAYFVFGSIYPIVTLILLNTEGARAACQTRKTLGTPDYLA